MLSLLQLLKLRMQTAIASLCSVCAVCMRQNNNGVSHIFRVFVIPVLHSQIYWKVLDLNSNFQQFYICHDNQSYGIKCCQLKIMWKIVDALDKTFYFCRYRCVQFTITLLDKTFEWVIQLCSFNWRNFTKNRNKCFFFLQIKLKKHTNAHSDKRNELELLPHSKCFGIKLKWKFLLKQTIHVYLCHNEKLRKHLETLY